MTNADKFLKNDRMHEFANDLTKFFVRQGYADEIFQDIVLFIGSEATPTLTEDERVILRNMPQKEWNYIFRDNMGNIQFEHLKANGTPNSIGRADWYNHLFQFIKERRRI